MGQCLRVISLWRRPNEADIAGLQTLSFMFCFFSTARCHSMSRKWLPMSRDSSPVLVEEEMYIPAHTRMDFLLSALNSMLANTTFSLLLGQLSQQMGLFCIPRVPKPSYLLSQDRWWRYLCFNNQLLVKWLGLHVLRIPEEPLSGEADKPVSRL